MLLCKLNNLRIFKFILIRDVIPFFTLQKPLLRVRMALRKGIQRYNPFGQPFVALSRQLSIHELKKCLIAARICLLDDLIGDIGHQQLKLPLITDSVGWVKVYGIKIISQYIIAKAVNCTDDCIFKQGKLSSYKHHPLFILFRQHDG